MNKNTIICSDYNIMKLYNGGKLIKIYFDNGEWTADFYPCEYKEWTNTDGKVTITHRELKHIAKSVDFFLVLEKAKERFLEVEAILFYEIEPTTAISDDIIAENLPFMAMEQNRIVRFKPGYYLDEVSDFASSMLRKYISTSNQEATLTPVLDESFNDAPDYKLPLPEQYKHIVTGSGYYEIDMDTCFIIKNALDGETHDFIYTNMREDLAAIINDKRKENNNYPIIILGNTNYIVTNSGEIKEIKNGFIKAPSKMSVNDALNIFLDRQFDDTQSKIG